MLTQITLKKLILIILDICKKPFYVKTLGDFLNKITCHPSLYNGTSSRNMYKYKEKHLTYLKSI